MLDTTAKPAAKPAATTAEETSKAMSGDAGVVTGGQETDGFQLVIDALKLNGIETIFGLPGIPITDLTRKLQAAGLRASSPSVMSRTPGSAPPIAGFMTGKLGICLTVSRPRLSQRIDGARQRHYQLLPDDPDQRLESEREVVDLQQGDYEEMDQLRHRLGGRTPRPFRVLTPRTSAWAWRGRSARAVSGRPGGVYLDLPAEAVPADHGGGGRKKVVDQGGRSAPRQIPAPTLLRARTRSAQGASVLIILGKGRGVRAGRCGHSRAGGKTGIPICRWRWPGPAPDTEQAASAARSYVLPGRCRW
jgi:oxalyl-CoA decarboxylase